MNLFPHLIHNTDINQIPPLYRYVPQQYVDEFFENGNLRFSTLYTCRSHEDLIRRDSKEGRSIFVARPDKDGNIWDRSHKNNMTITHSSIPSKDIAIPMEYNFPNMFLLSLSSEPSKKLLTYFKVNSLFVIVDMIGFIHTIKEAFNGFFKINNTSLNGTPQIGKIEYCENDALPYDFENILDDAVFTKSKKYRKEKEWRLCVVPTHIIELQPTIIKIQTPEKYCKRVNVENLL